MKTGVSPAVRLPDTVGLRERKRKKKPPNPPRGGRGGIRRRGRRRARTFVRRDRVVALVPVIGAGSELEGEPKLFMRLGKRPVIEHVVRRLLRCVGTVVVATPESQVEKARSMLGELAEVCVAGSDYVDTLRGMLRTATAPFVVVHNVSWPLASPALIREVILMAAEMGAASAVDFPDAPLGRVTGDRVSGAEDPRRIAIAQSPGGFGREVLEAALAAVEEKGRKPETVWELVQQAGTEIAPVENEEWNIRIETAMDWEIARRAVWPAIRKGLEPWRGRGKKIEPPAD